MSDDLSGFENVPFDPASMPTSSLGIAKAVWYRRPWVLASLALVAIVAISVVIDLPGHITKGQDAASQNSSIKEINSDLADCSYSVKEAFSFYNQEVSGKISSSNLTLVPRQLNDDEVACSFASEPVYDLTNNLDIDMTAAGRHINTMELAVQVWITDYALASIRDIQYLFSHPGAASTIRHLATQEVHLASERAKALHDLSDADHVLGVQLNALKIPSLVHLRGT